VTSRWEKKYYLPEIPFGTLDNVSFKHLLAQHDPHISTLQPIFDVHHRTDPIWESMKISDFHPMLRKLSSKIRFAYPFF